MVVIHAAYGADALMKWATNFIQGKYIMNNLINDPDWVYVPIIWDLISSCVRKSIVRIYSPVTRVLQIRGWGPSQGILIILKTKKKSQGEQEKNHPSWRCLARLIYSLSRS